MSDANINVQPASTAPAPASVQIKVFSAVDVIGNPVLVQAVALVDENGKPLQLMTEQTGLALVDAIQQLHSVLTLNGNGGLLPSGRGIQTN